jgi:hypothetical protein
VEKGDGGFVGVETSLPFLIHLEQPSIYWEFSVFIIGPKGRQRNPSRWLLKMDIPWSRTSERMNEKNERGHGGYQGNVL